ncbi:mRNA-decapping enzyme subunit 2 [Podila minutissima]|uniref:mRNA-decapping enzyme subunit 2 n=1 Tax=Podila minutissima TaxID=64525 RepID=A0A9P5VK31_9FUNG|nr:mRNA-decapping enzyme subunit 2 [Podila minutissima]
MEWTNVSFDYVLDDLSARFILNLPEEELRSVERIFFQIEQAHWFYEDFIRERNPALPSFSLKKFSAKFFQHCPLLHEWSTEHETAFANFMEYKIRVPVCGAIILNEAMDKCILVKGWVAKSCWGFPKGKINKDEPDSLCAIREVWEETGFDISSRITNEDYVELTKNDQRIRLYIVKGVPEDTVFETQTRKEISKIEWHRLVDLPATKPKPMDRGHYSGKESGSDRASNANAIRNFNRYYMVTPFVQKLKSWIAMQRKIAKRKNSHIPVTPMVDHSSLPVVSSSTASRDSDLLKGMLGIGVTPSPPTPQPHNHYLDTPPTGSHPSSESLKAILGIQNNNSTPTTKAFSPSRPAFSSPESSTTGNGSETLKALLGISSADNTPLPQPFGTSPTLPHGLANHGSATHRQDSSPSLPHPMLNRHSMPAKPQGHSGPGAFGRKSSVDLLALLNGGSSLGTLDGGGGLSPMISHFIQPSNGPRGGYLSSNGNSRPLSYGGQGKLGGSTFASGYSGTRSGNNSPRVDPRRVKTNSMQNFTFDLDALV